MPGDHRAAAIRPRQRRQDVHHRRLAGPVGAEQAEDLAAPDVEADVAQGDNANRTIFRSRRHTALSVLGIRFLLSRVRSTTGPPGRVPRSAESISSSRRRASRSVPSARPGTARQAIRPWPARSRRLSYHQSRCSTPRCDTPAIRWRDPGPGSVSRTGSRRVGVELHRSIVDRTDGRSGIVPT